MPKEQDGTEMTVNIILRHRKATGVVEYEADPRLVERLVEQVGLEGANGTCAWTGLQTVQPALLFSLAQFRAH